MENLLLAMQQQALFEFAVWIIAIILSTWVSYEVIKRAVRDGINAANDLTRFSSRQPNASPPGTAPEGMHWVLVHAAENAKKPTKDFSANS